MRADLKQIYKRFKGAENLKKSFKNRNLFTFFGVRRSLVSRALLARIPCLRGSYPVP